MIYDLDNNRLTSGQVSLESGEPKTLTVKIQCETSYLLRSTAVDDMTVEAKRSADAVWVNIETTPIDLSAWNGTLQNFDIRLTASTVSGIRRGADISVGK